MKIQHLKKWSNWRSRAVPLCFPSKIDVIVSCQNDCLITNFISPTKTDVVSTQNFVMNVIDFRRKRCPTAFSDIVQLRRQALFGPNGTFSWSFMFRDGKCFGRVIKFLKESWPFPLKIKLGKFSMGNTMVNHTWTIFEESYFHVKLPLPNSQELHFLDQKRRCLDTGNFVINWRFGTPDSSL